ncbi:MAG: V-type ATP synthase subunit F [Syntrophobacteraceae bacterium]
MKKIYIIGDIHTVSAFRLCGVEGVVCSPEEAPTRLQEVIGKKDAGIVLLTNGLAKNLSARIAQINLDMPNAVVVEIPGIDDAQGLRRSAVEYIAEALGISV